MSEQTFFNTMIRQTPIFSDSEKRDVIAAIKNDMSLKEEDKMRLLAEANQPTFWTTILHGAGGGAIAYAIARYLHMSKSAQMLMSMAGFGIGALLMSKTPESTATKWNSKYNVEEVI